MATPTRSHIHIRSRIRSWSWIWSLRYNLGVWLSLELSCLLFALQIDELPIEMRHNIYATLCPCYAPCGLSPVSERQIERERERENICCLQLTQMIVIKRCKCGWPADHHRVATTAVRSTVEAQLQLPSQLLAALAFFSVNTAAGTVWALVEWSARRYLSHLYILLGLLWRLPNMDGCPFFSLSSLPVSMIFYANFRTGVGNKY